MEGEVGGFDTFLNQGSKNVLGEMEAGGWGGSTSIRLGKDGLVAFAVVDFFGDVWRERHFTNLSQLLVEVSVGAFELDDSDWIVSPFKNGAGNALCEIEYGARFESFGRFDEGFKNSRSDFFKGKDFDFGTGGFMALETPRVYTGVVQHEHIAGLEHVDDFAKLAMLDFVGGEIKVKQSGRGSVGQRGLGDQIFGEFVVEIT